MKMKNHRSGFTLLEVMIASTIMTSIGLMVYLTLKSGLDTYVYGSVHADLNGQARTILGEITRDLRASATSTFSPTFPNNSATLTFRQNEGYSGGALSYGAPITYGWVLENGEIANGKDDNGDGRVDEGRVTRAGTSGSRVLSDDAANVGLTFTQDGSSVRVRLVLERRDENHHLVTYTRETTVQLRN